MRFVTGVISSAALITGLALATGAVAKPGLKSESAINARLLAVGIADEIRKTCDSISPRMIKALSEMKSIERSARSLGYSDDEIDTYVKNKSEKAKMRARGTAYIKKAGATPGDEASICTLGRAEIAKKSRIGVLLRAN